MSWEGQTSTIAKLHMNIIIGGHKTIRSTCFVNNGLRLLQVLVATLGVRVKLPYLLLWLRVMTTAMGQLLVAQLLVGAAFFSPLFVPDTVLGGQCTDDVILLISLAYRDSHTPVFSLVVGGPGSTLAAGSDPTESTQPNSQPTALVRYLVLRLHTWNHTQACLPPPRIAMTAPPELLGSWWYQN